MKNWWHVLILLTFKRVEVGATLDNIKIVILDAMATYVFPTTTTWPPNGFDGDLVFHGVQLM